MLAEREAEAGMAGGGGGRQGSDRQLLESDTAGAGRDVEAGIPQ